MRWKEIIVNMIAESEIFEMAMARKDAESKITGLGEPTLEHLIKILKWQDNLNYQKHIGDINSWLYKIQNIYIKGNKKPTQHDYYTWIFVDNVTAGEIVIRRWIKGLYQYHDLYVIRTDEEVYDIIKHMIYQISFELPTNNFDDIADYLPG